jgi:hypothetical protein
MSKASKQLSNCLQRATTPGGQCTSKRRMSDPKFGSHGNQKKLHSVLCSIVRVDTTTVIISSLFSRIKSVNNTSKKYNKFSNTHKYNEYLSHVFTNAIGKTLPSSDKHKTDY